MPDSSISKFFEKSREERLDVVAKFANLSEDDIKRMRGAQAFCCLRSSV